MQTVIAATVIFDIALKLKQGQGAYNVGGGQTALPHQFVNRQRLGA